ncbi:kh domain rna-binding protein [Colletotrichum chrysophilum]|uniref:Kh domain rna-binding protein n=1 Tax=Colletotrichum chrysophilum TaxID=1836956 RepID=A0AAD9E8Q1_9PEZI|nr:kh domain rna-binding protein [Colletotrichum chrysophilum]
MTPVQDIPSNGNGLVDSLDRLKVDDGEPRLGRVVTMKKINHNGLANGKTMGYSVRRGLSSLQTTVLGEWRKNEEGQWQRACRWQDHGLQCSAGVFLHFKRHVSRIRSSAHRTWKWTGARVTPFASCFCVAGPRWGRQRCAYFSSNNTMGKKAAQQRIKLTDNTEIPPPVLTTIIGDDGFTGMFPAFITLAGVFANSSEPLASGFRSQVTDEDFWNGIHMWTA